MRITFFSLLCISFFLISSCGGDDDTNAIAITIQDIQGSWNLTGMDTDAEVSLTESGQTERAPIVSSIANSTVVMTFNADGTWTSTGMVQINITYEETEMETTELTNGIGSGTYTIADGQVSIAGIEAENETDVEEPVPYTVISFQPNSRLVLDGRAMESIDFSGSIFSIDLEQTITLEQ